MKPLNEVKSEVFKVFRKNVFTFKVFKLLSLAGSFLKKLFCFHISVQNRYVLMQSL